MLKNFLSSIIFRLMVAMAIGILLEKMEGNGFMNIAVTIKYK